MNEKCKELEQLHRREANDVKQQLDQRFVKIKRNYEKQIQDRGEELEILIKSSRMEMEAALKKQNI